MNDNKNKNRRRQRSPTRMDVEFPLLPGHLEKQIDSIDSLDQVLHELRLHERGLDRRQTILQSLHSIVGNWIGGESSPFALIPFGSFALGVDKDGSDMDVLLLCSASNANRDSFFQSFVRDTLEQDDRVSDVHPLPNAYTPVLKFTLLGIPIDLLFCAVQDDTKLQQLSNGSDYPIDDTDLIGLDEVSVRSLNGARVSQMILEQLNPNQIEPFQQVLRTIKEWAQLHGLYSNVLGFLGGINFAIMVAYVCRASPEASTPEQLLKDFFETFANWSWPTPIQLGPIIPSAPLPGVEQFHVWSTNSNRDRHHLMPILTPAYPAMNSAYNVGLPQKRRLETEFQNALATVEMIERGEATWRDLLCAPHNFFQQHSWYLQIHICSVSEANHTEWFRFVESKLRLLMAGLEADGVVEVQPFAKFFSIRPKQQDLFVLPLVLHAEPEEWLGSEFLHTVKNWEFKKEGMDIELKFVQAEDLPDCVKNVGSYDTEEESAVTEVVSNVSNEAGLRDRATRPPKQPQACCAFVDNTIVVKSDAETASTRSSSFSCCDEDDTILSEGEHTYMSSAPTTPARLQPIKSWSAISSKNTSLPSAPVQRSSSWATVAQKKTQPPPPPPKQKVLPQKQQKPPKEKKFIRSKTIKKKMPNKPHPASLMI